MIPGKQLQRAFALIHGFVAVNYVHKTIRVVAPRYTVDDGGIFRSRGIQLDYT